MINVLDKGYVRLVDSMGNDSSILRAARVSYQGDRGERDPQRDINLINYLYKNKHTSPFEAVVFTFEIKCPIFIARQWHRHRTWSFNEVSARYTELPEDFYVAEPHNIGTQSTSNKQVRDIGVEGKTSPDQEAASLAMEASCRRSFESYRALLAAGVPRELARSVLPVSTYTRFYATVNLHNLFHFLRLRLHSHAQYEIRVYAEALLKLIEPFVPIAVKAFQEEDK